MISTLALNFKPLSHIPVVLFAMLSEERIKVTVFGGNIKRLSQCQAPRHQITIFHECCFVGKFLGAFNQFRFVQWYKENNDQGSIMLTALWVGFHWTKNIKKSRVQNCSQLNRILVYQFSCVYRCSCFQTFSNNVISSLEPKPKVYLFAQVSVRHSVSYIPRL